MCTRRLAGSRPSMSCRGSTTPRSARRRVPSSTSLPPRCRTSSMAASKAHLRLRAPSWRPGRMETPSPTPSPRRTPGGAGQVQAAQVRPALVARLAQVATLARSVQTATATMEPEARSRAATAVAAPGTSGTVEAAHAGATPAQAPQAARTPGPRAAVAAAASCRRWGATPTVTSASVRAGPESRRSAQVTGCARLRTAASTTLPGA